MNDGGPGVSVQRSGGEIDIGVGYRTDQLVDADLAGARAAGSAWMRTAYLAEPNTLTCATPSMVESARQQGLGILIHFRRLHRGRADRQEHDRMSAGFCLRKVGGWGSALGRLRWRRNGRLHVLRRPIDAAVQAELELNLGLALGAAGRHLVDAGDGENWFSSGEATDEAMVSGSAPGRWRRPKWWGSRYWEIGKPAGWHSRKRRRSPMPP